MVAWCLRRCSKWFPTTVVSTVRGGCLTYDDIYMGLNTWIYSLIGPSEIQRLIPIPMYISIWTKDILFTWVGHFHVYHGPQAVCICPYIFYWWSVPMEDSSYMLQSVVCMKFSFWQWPSEISTCKSNQEGYEISILTVSNVSTSNAVVHPHTSIWIYHTQYTLWNIGCDLNHT